MCEDGNTMQNKGHKGKESWKEVKLIYPSKEMQMKKLSWVMYAQYNGGCGVRCTLFSKAEGYNHYRREILLVRWVDVFSTVKGIQAYWMDIMEGFLQYSGGIPSS